MSMKWPGGIIRKTPVTPAGPLQNGAAPGMWTLAEASYWTKQGLWPLAGNILAVEDVFSTYLYTGTGAAQTITNGIDLAGKGGLVIQKERTTAYIDGWFWGDTVRGANNILKSQNANGQVTSANSISAFSSTGFTAGSNISFSGSNYASWTFREQPNFFDVVTYTGNGTSQTISHNLGVTPGCIIVKRTDDVANWAVWHRGFSNPATGYAWLNLTDAAAASASVWNNTAPTSTGFSVGGATATNGTGGTYVAYLFAHDTASTGIIQCGSFTATSGQQTVTLGWEPQWVMVKRSDTAQNWFMTDIMRSMNVTSTADLQPNTTNGEQSGQSIAPTATGFTFNASYFGAGTYIYMAIRRGPMKTPTLGTSVFLPTLATFSGTTVTNTGFVVDMVINKNGVATTSNNFVLDRLRGSNDSSGQTTLPSTSSTSAEVASSGRTALTALFSASVSIQNGFLQQQTTANNIVWAFRRAPGFFDEVCYTGTTSDPGTIPHNLGVPPEMMIVKRRNSAEDWMVYAAPIGANGSIRLNRDFAASPSFGLWGGTAPTATNFTVSQAAQTFESGGTYVNYLFASAPGVSKVGSYTGNGSSQTINCAFTTGARFVLIKRTDSTGDWYVWDSARGIVAGNDPYLALNSTAVEVTTNDSVDTDNTGFIVNQVAASNINVNAATYIFLAIA
jgi:hypothetical protein